MKVLICVLTCNRLFYLKNCVKSILSFIPLDDAQIMITDNCTIENGIDDFLNSLPPDIIVKRFRDRVPNELYRAMNYAIEYCIKEDIPIVNFVQDDYQYVWRNDNIIRDVVDLFKKRKKIGQIHTNFLWERKWKRKKTKCKSLKINDTYFGIFPPSDMRLCDNGFTRVNIYKKIGMYPQGTVSYDQDYEKTKGFGKDRYKRILNGEKWFSSKCHRIGLQRAMSFLPNQGMIFSCAYVRGTKRFGKYFEPPNDYFIKLLDSEQVDRIKRFNLKKRWGFIERELEADGWEVAGEGKHDVYSDIVEDV